MNRASGPPTARQKGCTEMSTITPPRISAKLAHEDGHKIECPRVDYDTSRIKIKSASYLARWKKLQTVEKIQTSIVATEEELKCTDKLKCRIDGTYNGEHHE
ncbi:Hypothetical protein NTJ_10071 [Nesidiocoris tenuis]|uniref:Uncharacterized protein n=1 Tax=Nesidiocoris tenuis TaxID=355587 RepID=A0ABN7AYN1_9HEMI|nr:Hypothetical protein NTJ_10071 [Nesidiocoris tenuis]